MSSKVVPGSVFSLAIVMLSMQEISVSSWPLLTIVNMPVVSALKYANQLLGILYAAC